MSQFSILFLLLAIANLILWRFGESLTVRLTAAAPVLACCGWYWLGGGRASDVDEPLWVFAAVGVTYFVTIGLLHVKQCQRHRATANATAD